MGSAQSAESGGRGSEELPNAPSSETMTDAPAIGSGIGDADAASSEMDGGVGGAAGIAIPRGTGMAPQIDVAMPMDISGARRSSEFHQPLDNSMPDSSFASSFGSFMSPPDGGPVPPKPAAQPVVMTWRHCQADSVFLAGDFNDWQLNTEMQPFEGEYVVILNLVPAKYHYKFVVDGEWVYAPEQATTADINGNVCNVLQVEAIESSELEQLVVESPRDSYSQLVPEGTEYSTEPPPLPTQLAVNPLEPRPPPKQPAAGARRHAGGASELTDTSASEGRPVFLDPPKLPPGALPDPTHVVINHLFCNTKHPGVMVYATTHRHDSGGGLDKFVTTVLYRPDKRPSEYRPLAGGGGYIPTAADGSVVGPRRDSEPNEC